MKHLILALAVLAVLGCAGPAYGSTGSCPTPNGVDCGGTTTWDPHDECTNCGVAWCEAMSIAYNGYLSCVANCSKYGQLFGAGGYLTCLALNNCLENYEQECNNQTQTYNSCIGWCGAWDGDVIN